MALSNNQRGGDLVIMINGNRWTADNPSCPRTAPDARNNNWIIIMFHGLETLSHIKKLEGLGVRWDKTVDHILGNGVVCYYPHTDLDVIRALDFVRHCDVYHDFFVASNSLQETIEEARLAGREAEEEDVVVLVDPHDRKRVREYVEGWVETGVSGRERVVRCDGPYTVVRVPLGFVEVMAGWEEVFSIYEARRLVFGV